MKGIGLLLLVSATMFGEEFLNNHQTVAAYVHAFGTTVSTNGITNHIVTIPRAEFDKVNEVRKIQARKIESWNKFQRDPVTNREYVTDYLRLLYSNIRLEMGIDPSVNEVFVAFAIGFEAAKKIEFEISQVKDKDIQMRYRWFQKFLEIPALTDEPPPPLNVPNLNEREMQTRQRR